MEVRVIELEDKKIKIEIIGETHTLLNPLVNELAKDERVEIATYHVPHPLEERSVLRVVTKEGNPIDIILEKIDKIIEDLKNVEFYKEK